MDHKLKNISEASSKAPSLIMSDPSRSQKTDQPFNPFDSSNLFYAATSEQSFPDLSPPLDNQLHNLHHHDSEVKTRKQIEPAPTVNSLGLEWDPKVMLTNLSFLEQKIHQVQDIVRSIISNEGQFTNQANELTAQQQLVRADLTCIIIQLISTAGTLLPDIKSALLSSTNSAVGKHRTVVATPPSLPLSDNRQQDEVVPQEVIKGSEYDEFLKGFASCDEGEELIKCLNNCGGEASDTLHSEDNGVKDYDDGDGDNLPPGSYEVLQLEKEEILAPHTHFCTICGKGFKRDANLRMHMRGHGDEYKTPAALAKPAKEASSEPALIKRYSCPLVGCKRNKEHKKFQPLKTILCVKNHYKRTHCDKSYTCSRCNTKKFSVIADLKTHEKHCGRDKWLCSCGTTFSRKDKLFGHVALFQGHTPALPMDDARFAVASDQAQVNKVTTGTTGIMDYNFEGCTSVDVPELDIKDDHGRGYFSPMNFDTCNFGGLDDFSRSAFDVSDSPFSFLPTEPCNFIQRDGEN